MAHVGNLFAELSREFISGNIDEVVDIITFVEASWGLNVTLLPAQKFILKCLYGLPLDTHEKYISVPDLTNEHVLYRFTEREFLTWLHAEGRCNTDETEGKTFQELVLSIGRRGTKCRDRDDIIATTEGSMSFGELLERLAVGERIGLPTYDPETLVRSVTYQIRAEANEDVECFEVETKRGIRETSSWNHPYMVWRDEWEKPQFVEMAKLQVGDRIATSACTGVFGSGGIGVARAALLGHFQGDGGTTEIAGYTTKSDTMLSDFKGLVESEFPEYVVKKSGKASFKGGYSVVKASGRFKQNESQRNEVVDWLREIGCFGKKAINKRVPDCVMKGSRDEVAVFLSRLFGCDGHANTEKTVPVGHGGVPKSHVGYCSASRGMADDVRHLLLKFGVHGVLSKIKAVCDGKTFDAWTIRIVDKDSLERFSAEIGIFSKESDVQRAVDAARRRDDAKGEFGCVPRGVWGYVKRMMSERELSGADVVGEHGVGAVGRLRQKYSPSRRKVASYGANVCDSFLMAMGTSDVLWDEVESLRPVGKKSTVDIEVEGTHIIGGDLVSHNSSIASFISNYELYKLVKRGDSAKHYGFQAGARVYILNVAPTDDQAGIVFDMIQQQAMECPYIRDRILHKTMTYFDLMTDADVKHGGIKKRASLLSMAGGCSSNGLRGRNAIMVIMDEMAFFIDNSGRFSGSEVYKALTPSIASFRRDGKVICISSPYAKFGAFYERWTQSFQEPDYTLAFKMYSSMANPTIPSEILRAARRRDRVGFMCEYGAEFSDSVTAWIDDEPEFRRCVVRESVPSRGTPCTKYYMGIDLGFKNDGTAVSIVHRDEKTNRIILDWADVWFSGSSDVWDFDDSIYKGCRRFAHLDVLKMSDIVAEIKGLSRWFPLAAGIFDQSSGYALAELLANEGLKQLEMENFTERKNHEVYQLAKRLYAENLLELYNHSVLIPEMLMLEGEKLAKGKILVRAPNRRGAHDDLSDAVVRAVWLCYNLHKDRAPNVATGTGGMVPSQGSSRYPNGVAVKQTTQAEFIRVRRKMHGEHPRELDRYKRRLPGAVR